MAVYCSNDHPYHPCIWHVSLAQKKETKCCCKASESQGLQGLVSPLVFKRSICHYWSVCVQQNLEKGKSTTELFFLPFSSQLFSDLPLGLGTFYLHLKIASLKKKKKRVLMPLATVVVKDCCMKRLHWQKIMRAEPGQSCPSRQDKE